MSFLDEKILKHNLENILSMMDDNPEDSLAVVEEMTDAWSFVELDDFYEDALLKNDTGINDLIWTVSIGCALIERCDLSRDEYIQWARKSQKDYAYTLLKLIGIETEEYKSAFEEKQTEEKKIHNDKLVSDLKQKKQLISWSNTSTDYTLFGESIVMSDRSGDLVELFSCLEEAHEFASEVLLRELDRRCSNCEEALDNIVKVLDNAGDAQWVKCRRYLKQKDIAESEIERIYNLYMETAGSSRELKEEFDTACKMYGAVGILNQELMESVSNGMDFYIIPSSVHETILVPYDETLEVRRLNEMVREVNATQVQPEEVLADHVYIYDASRKEVMKIGESNREVADCNYTVCCGTV